MKTISLNVNTVDKKWVVVDAADQVLGRIATKVAAIIRGKTKPTFTPHVDCGDNVVVINAGKIKLTGNKWDEKKYISYSGYPGGQKVATAAEVMAKNPIKMVEKSVKGMLPKGPLGYAMIKKMKVYAGNDHQHSAQQPQLITIK